MKRNGTTSKGTTRWRCTTCGASSTNTRPDRAYAANFNVFIDHVTGKLSMTECAKQHGVSRWTLNRRFDTFWYIQIPDHLDRYRIHDQIFIDGTHTGAGLLLIACTDTHVINWVWVKSESTKAYRKLLEPLQAPLVVVLDGGKGAYSAIKQCWPSTRIQRCLVHAQRVVRQYVTSRPRTDAGRAIYKLALKLTNINTVKEAAEWTARLQEFHSVYRTYMNQKTRNPDTGAMTFTHDRVRKAYNSLANLERNKWLFGYLQPPPEGLATTKWASTTNRLEGGFNSPLKDVAKLHRGRSGEHQRLMLDWWLYLRTQAHENPADIARRANWGRDALAKVNTTPQQNTGNQETGRPALYDNAIGDEYSHNLGIQKGWIH